MKKNVNKKVVIISVIVLIMVAVVGMVYINKNHQASSNDAKAKTDVSGLITATVGKASFGSIVNVNLSDAGKKQYKGATKYQVYYDKKPITQKQVIGKATTAFPVRKEKDKVEIKLIKADDKEVGSVELNLQKGTDVK
ncbi:hypothetical protein [Clostridium tagluense]|uniref:Uncharacterized protein n=1 Tax=Clostridium tagluense TaxID=360422 RepID=A0A401URC6_9CLOT|nr:hypothetical protein [Clostridium tagluense]GCD12070.1 hypothetical protein Ctaglu_36930 [Clostridium tagluense]